MTTTQKLYMEEAVMVPADEIARLRAERDEAVKDAARLREALKGCAAILSGGDMSKSSLINALEAARAALAATGSKS